jgi:hypothetical protein
MRLRVYSDLETACRSQGDLLNAQNPSTGAASEYMEWINEEWAEIYDKLIMSGEKYWMTTVSSATVFGQTGYQLPNDFYKLRGVEVQLDATQFFNAHRANFEQRNDFLTADWSWPRQVLYDIWGQPLSATSGSVLPPLLKFFPAPSGVYNFNYYYFAPAVVLVNTTDQLDLQNGHEKALIFGVCARAAMKLAQFDRMDRFIAERDKQINRIVNNMRDMDHGEPKMVRIARGRPAWRAYRWWRW